MIGLAQYGRWTRAVRSVDSCSTVGGLAQYRRWTCGMAERDDFAPSGTSEGAWSCRPLSSAARDSIRAVRSALSCSRGALDFALYSNLPHCPVRG